MLDELKGQRKILESKLESVKSLEKYYYECQKFNLDDNLMKQIKELVNAFEEEEFDFVTFSLKESDKQEIRYRSPYEGMYGVNGAELTATMEPYVHVKTGDYIKFNAIIDKNSYEIFRNFTFSSINDLKNNLSVFLNDKKHLLLFENMISRFYFLSSFPYVSKYLELLTNWRFENKSLDIPDEILTNIRKELTDSLGIKKLNKE